MIMSIWTVRRRRPENPEELARLVSDRHKGIGADGLILIKASEQADFEMAMYNAGRFLRQKCAATASAAWPSTSMTTV